MSQLFIILSITILCASAFSITILCARAFHLPIVMPLVDLWYTSESDDRDSDAALLRRLKQKVRTERARVVRAKKRAANTQSSASSQSLVSRDWDDAEDIFRTTWLADLKTQHRANWYQAEEARHRCIFSYLHALVQCLKSFLQRFIIHHILMTQVVDDCEVKLQHTFGHRRCRSPIMNNCQFMHLTYEDHGQDKRCTVPIHQPFLILEGTTGQDLWTHWSSWMLSISTTFLGFVWQHLGLTIHDFDCCTFKSTAVCHDALKTNQVMRNTHRLETFVANKARQPNSPYNTYFDINCLIHQFGLSRKHVFTFFKGFWSNVVRLGHLFETHSFRRQFLEAMTYVIITNFGFFKVPVGNALPPEIQVWKTERKRILNIPVAADDIFHIPSGRLAREVRHVIDIIDRDNGAEPESSKFVMWSNWEVQTEQQALITVVAAYATRFGGGYPNPMLYRWKHGDRALAYINDGYKLRCILPRTLAQMVTRAPADSVKARIAEILDAAESLTSTNNGANPEFDIEELLAADSKSAAHNVHRLTLTSDFFNCQDAQVYAALVPIFSRPIEHGVNTLFNRTALQFKINVSLDPDKLPELEDKPLSSTHQFNEFPSYFGGADFRACSFVFCWLVGLPGNVICSIILLVKLSGQSQSSRAG